MKVDILIIGAGQAGIPLAKRLARTGREVILVERAELGGTCVNYGCTPTKTMIASAKAAHIARDGARLGVHAAGVRVELSEVVQRKDKIVEQLRESALTGLESEKPRLRLVHGAARFVGEREIDVAGQRYLAEAVILDVGARPAVPQIPGLDKVPWLDNHRIMDLRALPRHLVILGGGYIGCEFGQMFRRFGAQVTIIDRNPRILAREDPDVSAALEDVFRAEGINLHLGAAIKDLAPAGDDLMVRTDTAEFRGSHLLVAAGRRPNTDDLSCDAAGIRLDQRGFIVVDDHYQTTAKGVYAVGDASGAPQFTHTAWDDHRLLFDLLTGRGSRGRSSRLIPYTVFTDPPVARVGLSERQAQKLGIRFETATMPFRQILRAIETGETAGVMKVLMDPGTEQVLGAAIVGADAGELIHIFVPMMAGRTGLRAVIDAEFVHPTFAEGVQELVMRLERFRLDRRDGP